MPELTFRAPSLNNLYINRFLERYIDMEDNNIEKDKTLVRFQTEFHEGNKTHKFNIQYYTYEEDGIIVAYCPALDMTSTGYNFNEAIANFYEHFQLYVETAIEDGTLIEDLKAHGWKVDGVTLIQPSFKDLLNSKDEFRNLLESTTEFDRGNAKISIPVIA